MLAYAGVDVSELRGCSRMFIHFDVGMDVESLSLGRERYRGRVIDQAWFCEGVAATNKLEFLKWAREVKHCEWDEWTINGPHLKVISRC